MLLFGEIVLFAHCEAATNSASLPSFIRSKYASVSWNNCFFALLAEACWSKGFDLFGVEHFWSFDAHGTIKHGLGIVGVDALCVGVEGEEGIGVERYSVGTSKCGKRLYFCFSKYAFFMISLSIAASTHFFSKFNCARSFMISCLLWTFAVIWASTNTNALTVVLYFLMLLFLYCSVLVVVSPFSHVAVEHAPTVLCCRGGHTLVASADLALWVESIPGMISKVKVTSLESNILGPLTHMEKWSMDVELWV